MVFRHFRNYSFYRSVRCQIGETRYIGKAWRDDRTPKKGFLPNRDALIFIPFFRVFATHILLPLHRNSQHRGNSRWRVSQLLGKSVLFYHPKNKNLLSSVENRIANLIHFGLTLPSPKGTGILEEFVFELSKACIKPPLPTQLR
ncbi:hypothetical protein QUA08_30725 [Microcoleus sp. T3B2]|uniref:hypothetical protein n=1 Tax=Microcoleus sp. T3B2 TaxID=3055426 RepID=UPI002FCEE6A7